MFGAVCVVVIAGIAIAQGMQNTTAFPNPGFSGGLCVLAAYVIYKFTDYWSDS